MILLTGATGNIGKELLRLFKGRNLPARVIVRSPEKLSSLAYPEIQVVRGDLQDSHKLLSCMEGVDKAFLLMANVKEQADIERAFIDSAKTAGVEHIVKLSACDADKFSPSELNRNHAELEEYLTQSGVHFTIVRPNYFMQNMLHSAGAIAAENEFCLPAGSASTAMVDTRDIAEVVLEALQSDCHLDQTYTITGPESLSFKDVARCLTKELGRTIRYEDIGIDEFRKELWAWEPDDWYVNAVSEVFLEIANGSEKEVTNTFEQITGRKPRSFAAFVRDHLSAFGC